MCYLIYILVNRLTNDWVIQAVIHYLLGKLFVFLFCLPVCVWVWLVFAVIPSHKDGPRWEAEKQ